MLDEDLLFALALQCAPNIGDITAKKLITHCGSPEGVLNESKKSLLKITGIGSYTINQLNKSLLLHQAEKELTFIKNNHIRVRYYQNDSYPTLLKQCVDGPILLFQRGNISIKNRPIISIVGARKITNQGIANCEAIIEKLSPYNPIIVSGFAYGADITAQKSAIKHHLQTIGCLAHGLNQIYPKAHRKYMSAVENHGGFFTDFWSTDKFVKSNFLKRNRIIAGLSEATIIIESAERGGSLVTADIANSYNREVFAVPGRINDSQSVGCNNLIKFQRAHMLSLAEDIPYILNWKFQLHHLEKNSLVHHDLEADERRVYNFLLVRDKDSIDNIARTCQMPVFKMSSLLLNMELKGLVKPLSGKYFEIIRGVILEET
ncbi:DNA-processing protein DprA [Flavobacteriaceae bacterium]|nr:DNA-processing protein DprA [Flavobacteriaceae bacterium]